jgi:hypothetical protein
MNLASNAINLITKDIKETDDSSFENTKIRQ